MAEYWTYDHPNKDSNNITRMDGANWQQLETLLTAGNLIVLSDPANVSTHGGGIALCETDETILYAGWTKYANQAQGKIDFEALIPADEVI